jgi:hypothetical protein
VNLNFFCEKHGKNTRDAHFSMVSRFLKSASLFSRLNNSQDVANAINDGQRRANENRQFDGERYTFLRSKNFT